MNTRLKRWAKRTAIVVVAGLISFLLIDLLAPLPPPKPYSRIVYARDGSMLQATLSADDKWRMRTRIAEVPSTLLAALIAKEDQYFYYHPGVNPFALGRAAFSNLFTGARVSGASTITMQVARMLEPKPRTLLAKVQEIFRALQLEWHYSKAEILEMYLSYLPYGGNVEGVMAASHLYFGRTPQRLSLSQAIVLTVIPNRPNSLRPDLHAEALRLARDKWARRFAAEGIFDQAALADALREPVAAERLQLPATAPQFSLRMLASRPGERIWTSIDPRIQARSALLLHNHVQRARRTGVHNGALLVVDNQTMEVLAYCGSADFADKAALGEVDAVQAIRSPGSTLKPFLYANAFDRGLLTPKMKVLDVPFEAGGYMPDNYDKTCTGEVSAEYALRNSLNLPAVRLLDQMGMRGFVQGLSLMGFQGIAHSRKDMGLSVVLGGCGVRLDELVHAYAAFAHGGVLRPLRFDPLPRSDLQPVNLCSPESAYLVTDILAGLERPDLPQGLLDRSKLPRIAWKTGTSFGRRDAWAIGFNPRYTIGVWMGNMDGSAVQGLSGAATATPLLVELFNALSAGQDKVWFAQPAGIEKRQVCSLSGRLPGTHCPHTYTDLRIRARSPLGTCDHMRPLYTDMAGKVRYCPACLPTHGWQLLPYRDLDPELLGWMQRKGMQVQLPPPHNPACTAVYAGSGPSIVSPRADGQYLIPQGEELVLHAAAQATTTRLYWYADDNFLGSTTSDGKLAFAPPSGKVKIGCMDDQGQMSRIEVEVGYF
jgi:penicillin-binding protein 1C